jgi:hypothetical protein
VSPYLGALVITLVVETPIVAALFPGRRLRLAITCAAATTATHLLLHFAFPRLLPAGVSPLLLGEAFATAAEAGAYALASRDPGRSLVASALANSASFVTGLLVFQPD